MLSLSLPSLVKSANTLRREYPIGEKLNREPLVQVVDNFLSDEEIESVLAVGAQRLGPAKVTLDEGDMPSEARTGRNCWITHDENTVVQKLCDRLSELVGVPLSQAESLQLIHYSENQEYGPHFDSWRPDTEAGRRSMTMGGQRLVTCLLYLNDVEEGGGTTFPKLNLTVEAKRGRMVLFHNCFTDSINQHPYSLHGGMPVIKGEKWACNLWFRERDYC